MAYFVPVTSTLGGHVQSSSAVVTIRPTLGVHVVLLLIRTGGAGAGDDWQVGGLLIFVVRTRAHHTYLKDGL